MSPQPQHGDSNSRPRPRAHTTANFSSFSSWLRADRQPAPTPIAAVVTTSQPVLSMEALIEALTPPNQPSLGHARSLANVLSSYSPIPRPSTLSPILASLCSVRAPTSLQAAGYEIICAYYENDEASAFETADRLAYMSLFIPSTDWSQELWEPRFRALRAMTKYGKEILGMESAFLGVLQAWIQSTFDALLDTQMLEHAERAERERTLEVLSQFLTEVVNQSAIIARLPEEELVGILEFFAGLVDRSIAPPVQSSPLRRDSSMSSLNIPESPSPTTSTPSPRLTQTHRRHPSSLSISSLFQQKSPPIAIIKHPAHLAVSVYLAHLNSQIKNMTSNVLEAILPLLFRALAYHATPLPRLSITSRNSNTSPVESQITDALDSLLSGPYAATCMIILKQHLLPPGARDGEVAKCIQATIGAHRTLRNYIRRGLCARLARAYISRTSSMNYVPSGAPSLLHLERDFIEHAWPKDDVSAWDAGKLGRMLCKSVEAWVDFSSNDDPDIHGHGRDTILEEAAGTLKDVLEELDSRDDNVVVDEEEACAVGETLYQLARSIHPLKTPDGQPLLMPLAQPNDATSPFLRLMCSLLARDHKTYINPPLSTTLLSVADHLSDMDTATLPVIMSQQHDLLPTSPEWLNNWEAILRNPSLLTPSRPLTRHAFMQALQSVHDSIKDMPGYRKPLADLLYTFCERKPTDAYQHGEAMWHILGDEVVRRTVEAEEGSVDSISSEPIGSDHEQDGPSVERFFGLLTVTALSADSDEDDTTSNINTEANPSSPTQIAGRSSSVSPQPPRTQSDSPANIRDSASTLPSVMSILTSLTTPRSQTAIPQVVDDQPPDSTESSPVLNDGPLPKAACAVMALVYVFSQLAFTPFSLSENNLILAVQVFRVLVNVLEEGKSQKARLTALQFLMRIRADREHRLYFVDSRYDPDEHIFNLASLIDRVVPRASGRGRSEESHTGQADIRRARPRVPPDRDTPRISQSRDAPPSTSVSNRSRSRVTTVMTNTPSPASTSRSREPIWQIPEQLPFSIQEADTPSEALISHSPIGSEERQLLLPVSIYLAAIVGIIRQERDWEVLSYVLCHLPTQLANKHLFCGPICRDTFVKLLLTLATGVLNGDIAADIELWPQSLRPRDVHGLAYHSLCVLIGYRPIFDVQQRHLLVEVFQAGLNGQPPTIKCCIHALSLAAFEMPTSMTRWLTRILERLTQIMSNPTMAVHILAFLSVIASLPNLYANFTESDFKLVFGVALKYLQHHNRPGSSPTGSWALSQHVRFISYYVVYAWFLALKLQDRPHYVNYITRQLLIANEGRDEIDERTEVCFDWLARYTYGSADPRPADSLLNDIVMNPTVSNNSNEGCIGEKTWIWGNSVVTIRVLERLGWIEVISRRPSGLTKFLCRVENVPLVGPGDVNPDPVSVPASLMMDYRPPAVAAPSLVEGEEQQPQTDSSHQSVVQDLLSSEQASAEAPAKPDSIQGYVWSRTAPSQRRKFVVVNPSYFALQLSAYPYQHLSPQCTPVVNQGSLSTFLRNLDRMPVIDTHKVGILYVAPGQTQEAEILRNAHGSPAYTRFLEGIGRLINLRGQVDVYAGGLNPDEDGEYAYAWWDDIGQVLFHTATMMPSDPQDPNSDKKKRHIGNDFVRIVWNDSGVPYRFDTLTTQFQFINIVIEAHSVGAIAAFSNRLYENEYFKVTVQRAPRMPEFTPIGDFKLISAQKLPLLVRQLSLLADWFGSVFSRTQGDTDRVELTTNWQSRLQAIRRFRKTVSVPRAENAQGMMAQEMQRDFTNTF